MNSLKSHHLVTIFAILLLTFFVALVPEQAQAATNPFTSFTQSIQQKWNGLMLRLPGGKSGRSVLAQSLSESEKVKSAEVSWQVKADLLNESNSSLGTVSFTFGGPATFTSLVSPEDYTQQAKMLFEINSKDTNTKAVADVFIDPKAMYLKLTELPDLGASVPPEAMSQLLNQWVQIPSSEPQTEETKANPEEVAKMREAAKKLLDSATISQAKREKFDGKGVFVVDVVLPDDAVLAYIQEVEEITKSDSNATSVDMESVKRFLDGTSEFKMVLYVDDSSFLVRRMVIPLQFDFKAMMEQTDTKELDLSVVGVEEQPVRMKLDITVDTSRFNESFALQAPTEFVPFTEFMGSMMPATPAMEAQQKKMMTRPAELPELTEQEKAMLKEYGLEVEDLY